MPINNNACSPIKSGCSIYHLLLSAMRYRSQILVIFELLLDLQCDFCDCPKAVHANIDEKEIMPPHGRFVHVKVEKLRGRLKDLEHGEGSDTSHQSDELSTDDESRCSTSWNEGNRSGVSGPWGGTGRCGGRGEWGSTVVGDWVRCGRSLSRCRCLGSS